LGVKPPINFTAGYGRKHQISFRVPQSRQDQSPISSSKTVLLTGLSSTKQNGFWKKTLGNKKPPVEQNMENCFYFFPAIISAGYQEQPPIKAKDAEIYLVRRETASEFPNWYLTIDFKSFKPLTNVHPEKKYNWLTAELVNWLLPDGKRTLGILYKPENFDTSKKYPIIFQYYETRSNRLNLFWAPELSNGTLNVPWYVSNGYLVFEPDIYYTAGHTGLSAVNAVVSAARHLSKFSFVDSTKMGLQGISFGGFETNSILTNSNLFAAAQESAGISDATSHYGDIGFYGKHIGTMLYETGQANLRATPWERPDLYIENSPIFKVDKIATPLLIMHNKEDVAVPFIQGVELFTAMRRLQKPVWMLQYDGEGHIIQDQENQLDFTIRQEQFFDHYLKGKSAPVWMTEGIKAHDRGFKSGLGYSGN